MSIYDNIKRRADKLGLPINVIEVVAGLGNGTIRQWQSGTSPMVSTLKKVAKVLKCSVEDLIKEEEE